jgi:CheY-like chemotaxis protein
MGGRIWVESDPGKGSAFHFTCRFEALADGDGTKLPGMQALEGLRVLAVDDNATNRRIIHDMLVLEGVQVEVAESGSQALDLLRRAQSAGAPFQLAILDAQMPIMDGFDLAEKILAEGGLLRPVVMMLSSADLSSDIPRCRKIGIACHVTKPVSRAGLRESMLRALGSTELKDPAGPESACHALRRLSILLAEDNLVNQKLASRMLEKRGHQITAVLNGREAIQAMEHASFDVVLMDVQMPEMDGWEAAEEIRRRERTTHRHTPILAVTAHALKDHEQRCYEAGMDGFITKPFEPTKLFEAVESVMKTAPSLNVP